MLRAEEKYTAEELVKKFLSAKVPKQGQYIEEGKTVYDEIQPGLCSNENNAYMRNLVKPGDRVFLVSGNGDQSFDFMLYGAKEIYGVDINPLQIPIVWLKYQAIANLPKYRNYLDFIINTQGNRAFGEYYMEQVLKGAEDSLYKEFWSQLTSVANPMAIRKKHLLNEDRFIINKSERIAKFEYLSESNYRKLRENMKTAKLTLSEGSIFDAKIPDDINILHLSNLHNFMTADTYLEKIDKLIKQLKDGASIIIYCIGFKAEWFEAVKTGQMMPVLKTDINQQYVDINPIYLVGIQQQIAETTLLYQGLLEKYEVQAVPVASGKGYKMYNTTEDTVLIIKK